MKSKTSILYKLITLLIIGTFTFNNVIYSIGVSEHDTTYATHLAPYTTFPTDTAHNVKNVQSMKLFDRPLQNNKQFVLAAMSIAEYLLFDGGNVETLPKWIQHNFSDIFKEWTSLILQNNAIVKKDNSIVFSIDYRDEQYNVEVFLKKTENGSLENFNIRVVEKRNSNRQESLLHKKVFTTEKEIVAVGFSVLSSKIDDIEEEVKSAVAAGVDIIHLDQIDGIFTPGLPPFDCSEQIAKISHIDIPLSVHLMTENPSAKFVQNLAKCGLKPGRDTICLHFEAFKNLSDLYALIKVIRNNGFYVTLAINPETQIEDIRTVIQEINEDLASIMIMSIIPGAGSRPYILGSSDKVQELRFLLESMGLINRIDIIVDGGLNNNSLTDIITSDADEVISRSWLLDSNSSIAEGVAEIKKRSRHRIEFTRLSSLLNNWNISNYLNVVDAIVRFCNNDDTFTKEEMASTIKRMYSAERVSISRDRVIDVYYSDKLLRFHSNDTLPIEHLGLKDRTYYDGINVKVYTGNVTAKSRGDYILGISGSWHDSSVVLVKNGKIIAALEEERMTREKHDGSLFPVNATMKLLTDHKISWNDIKHVALGWNFNLYVDTPHSANPNEIFFNKMDDAYAKTKGIPVESVIRRDSAEKNKKRFDVSKVEGFLSLMAKKYGTDYEPRVSFVEHSQSHAASAYYLSGFDDKVLTLAIDGYGGFESGSVWLCENGDMQEITKFQLPNSMGWMWSAVTEFLGFKPVSDEGQVMGFAPYGEPWDKEEMERVNALRKIFKDYMRFDPDTETLIANPENYYYGEMCPGKTRLTKSFYNKMKALGIEPYPSTGQDISPSNVLDRPYANLAYVLQERTSRVITDMVRHYFKNNSETKGVSKLALSGGIALNILSNGKLVSDGVVYGEDIFVQPAAGDSGVAIGAALSIAKEFYGNNVSTEMVNADYGPFYSDSEIKSVLDEFGLEEGRDYHKVSEEELVAEAAKRIASRKAIAWFQGKSEIGPRALGNRSILLNLTDVQANNTANIIKGRQPWRPSALSILLDDAPDYFMGIGKAPFMVMAFPLLYSKSGQVLSGRHEFGDKLARPQTVSKEGNPLYWNLLNKIKQNGGIPAVVNTSFNKQEPLVEHPQEALDTFYYMNKVDSLFLGNYIVEKTDNLKPRIISLQEEQSLHSMIERAVNTGDINLWISVFDTINNVIYPNSHKIEIVMDCGNFGFKKLKIPLVKDLFAGPLKEYVLNFIAAHINNNATEFGAQKIYIGCTFKKMERTVHGLIQQKMENNFPRMKYFANFGKQVDILKLSERDKLDSRVLQDSDFLVNRLSLDDSKGTYVGVDIGATRIKCVLVKNNVIEKSIVQDTTFDGGQALGQKIKKLVTLVAESSVIDGIGIAFPGVVDSSKNELIWLVNYEPKWENNAKTSDMSLEYKALKEQISLLKDQYKLPAVKLLNDGTAFGICALNRGTNNDAVVVTLGTGIGCARIENGMIDVSRIEQSGTFAINVSNNAALDIGTAVNGGFAAKIRDETGKLISPSDMAKRMVSWFKVMYALKGDKNFIVTGGIAAHEYGTLLQTEINKILMGNNINTKFVVSFDSKEFGDYGGALGAAQFAMKTTLTDGIDALHDINMTMASSQKNNPVSHYIISEELVPVAFRTDFRTFLFKLYKKYPFLKEAEQIHMVKNDNLHHIVEELLSKNGSDSAINVALSSTEDLDLLSGIPKVKALVFSGDQKDAEFLYLEGIIAALRSMQQKNIISLMEIYEILTGKKFDTATISETDLLKALSNPKDLSQILVFYLKPMPKLTVNVEHVNKLLQYIEASA